MRSTHRPAAGTQQEVWELTRELAREGALAAEVWEAVTPLATGGWPHPSRPVSHAAGYLLQPPTAAAVMSATTASHSAPSLLLP